MHCEFLLIFNSHSTKKMQTSYRHQLNIIGSQTYLHKNWKKNQQLIVPNQRIFEIPLCTPLLGIVYKNRHMAMCTSKKLTLRQMVTFPSYPTSSLRLSIFPFWCSFFFVLCCSLVQGFCTSSYVVRYFLPINSLFYHAHFFS